MKQGTTNFLERLFVRIKNHVDKLLYYDNLFDENVWEIRFSKTNKTKIKYQIEKSLFSFELKRSIDFSTLREYFFQAVSNSSWANEGYLVALNYYQDPDFMDELRRLNNAFGIGFIKLNAEDYTQSEILLSAKENELDWNTIDRLCEENQDFKSFVHTIASDLDVDEMRNAHDFDAVFTSDEEFQKYVKEKQIQ